LAISAGIEADAAGRHTLHGMDDRAHALDRDGLALHRLESLVERRLFRDLGSLGHVLAQHQLH
jgi:hypothetical protein